MASRRRIRAVLFDLDGTLVDSAPDLIGTLNRLRLAHDLEPLPADQLRHLAAHGALGMIEAGFGERPELDRTELRSWFLEDYERHLWNDSQAFAGIEALLHSLAESGLAMAVVTNKLAYLAEALVRSAGWQTVMGCVIGGDTTPFPKPHPAPVLEACRRLGVHPCETLMLGDDRRDIEAGRAAGSLTAVAAWGYLAPAGNAHDWRAAHYLVEPAQLFDIVNEINEP